jgi:hypothetical protein
VESATAQVGRVVEERVAAVESHVAAALEAFRTGVPDVLRDSIRAAVADAVSLVDLVREQAGSLAQTVAQVSQNADRQVRSYTEWADRAQQWQIRLDQTLAGFQTGQQETLARQRQQVEQALAQIGQSLSDGMEGARKSQELMSQAVNYFGQRIVGLDEPIRALLAQVQALNAPVQSLGAAFAKAGTPIVATSDAIVKLNDAAANLARAFTVTALAEQKHVEATQSASAAFAQSAAATAARLDMTHLGATLRLIERAVGDGRLNSAAPPRP